MANFNIEEVSIGDAVDFISPFNRATSKVKDVDNQNRMVLINYFEDPELAIDRVNKWVSFDLLKIISKNQ